MNIKKVLITVLLMGVITSASAATSEPGSIANYLNVFLDLMKGTGGNLSMALIAGFSGYKAWANSTSAPIIWGALAIVLVAASPYIAPNLSSSVGTFMDINTTTP